jgi:hypothetical protein
MKIAKRRTEAFLAFLHGVRGSAWLNMPAINVLGFYTANVVFSNSTFDIPSRWSHATAFEDCSNAAGRSGNASR